MTENDPADARERHRLAVRKWSAANPEYRHAYRKAHQPSIRKYARKYRESNVPVNTWHNIRHNARRQHIPCTLTLADVSALLEPMQCSVTGVPVGKANGKRGPWSPAIDRVRPARGYVPGNVRLVCWRFSELRRRDPFTSERDTAERVRAEYAQPFGNTEQ